MAHFHIASQSFLNVKKMPSSKDQGNTEDTFYGSLIIKTLVQCDL